MVPLMVMLAGTLVARAAGFAGWSWVESWRDASGLMALLVAMFPANIHAARTGFVLAGRPPTPLVWRLPVQLAWIAALWWVARAAGAG